jgi:hypothetical protein
MITIKIHLDIHGDNASISIAQYWLAVGRALTTWADVESSLAEFYCNLVVGRGSPIDGALATYSILESFQQKMSILTSCFDQMLYIKEADALRTSVKIRFKRLLKLNETRNKIAHGGAQQSSDNADEYKFHPFLSLMKEKRYDVITGANETVPSIIKKPTIWDISELVEHVDSLDEAQDIVDSLTADLRKFYLDHSELLQAKSISVQDHGHPFQGYQRLQN